MQYRERVTPGLAGFAIGLLVIPAILLVCAPINAMVGPLVAVTAYFGYCVTLLISSPRVEIANGCLRVSSASIPVRFIGDPVPYDTREAARRAAGVDLDVRAWMCLRGWCPTSIKIPVVDDRDPVPYWLCSTRRPRELAAAIRQAKAEAQAKADTHPSRMRSVRP